MTLSPDEQPLTRRQLRELERTMSKKDRQDPAKVAEEAARRASSDESTVIPPLAAQEPSEATPATPDESADAPRVDEPEQASSVSHEDVEDAVVVQEPDTADTAPSFPVSEPVSSFAPEATASHPIVEELVIDDVPLDDDPDDSDSGTEITVESLSSGPILAPIFQTHPVVPDENSPATVDDHDASFDDLISARTVGSTNPSQTSALVLPAVPSSMDMGTALDETGEVIITGSIDLPSSMGANGAPAAGIESSELDALLDQGEAEQSDGEVAPVSASRAVSTGASNNALIAPPKRHRISTPTVLAIIAGVLAAGVVGLLFAVFVFRIF